MCQNLPMESVINNGYSLVPSCVYVHFFTWGKFGYGDVEAPGSFSSVGFTQR